MAAQKWRTEDWVAVYLGFFIIALILAAFSNKWFDFGNLRSTFRWTTEAQLASRAPDWTAALEEVAKDADARGLEAARRALPTYAHRFAPKKFTQHQLFACLVLKTHQKEDYRGICAMLADSPDLLDAIGMKEVPHYTTLQKACARLIRSARVRRGSLTGACREKIRRPHCR